MFLEAASPDIFHRLFGFASFGDETMRALTSGGASQVSLLKRHMRHLSAI